MKQSVRVLVFTVMVLCFIGSAPVEVLADESDVLTVNNCKDLATLLKVKDADDPFVKKFAQKYNGKKIEFDGYCWDWVNHTSQSPFSGEVTVYKTRFDTLVWAGNVKNAETGDVGPTFRVNDVPSFSTTPNRSNVHIVATVDSYDDSHAFLMIDLVSIKSR
jgi:hypothetical protein